MPQAAAETEPFRYYGLDIIRLLSFVAIAFFHISLIHYYETNIPLSEQSIIAIGIELYARSISFSGFTIVLLSSFLTAFSSGNLQNRLRLFGVLTAAWMVLSSLMSPNYSSWLAWDIYPLYLTGIIFCTVSEIKFPKVIPIAMVLGALMLWIPFWNYSHLFEMSDTLRNILGFASCANEIAEWPLLPWVGLIFLGYGLGYLLRKNGKTHGVPLKRWEYLLIPLLLAISIPQWGPFFHIQLGDRFSCEVYRMPPTIFWSHMIWVVALMRLSVAPGVNAWLGKFSLIQWVSNLAMSRKFWAAYILNYGLAHLLSYAADALGVTKSRFETEIITWFALIFLPLTELATRGVLIAIKEVDRRIEKRRS